MKIYWTQQLACEEACLCTYRDAAQAKERCALRATSRMRRRQLSKTFGVWRLRVVEPDRQSCLLKQVLLFKPHLHLSTAVCLPNNVSLHRSNSE